MSPKKKSALGAQFRQGDVLIIAVAALPDGLTRIDPKADPRGLVLAEGEATSHAHAIDAQSITIAGTDGASLFFAVGAPTRLLHQEHDPIPLAPGLYRAIRQREYHPEAIRNVAD